MLEYHLKNCVYFRKKRQRRMSLCFLHPSFQMCIKFSSVVGILFCKLLGILNPFILLQLGVPPPKAESCFQPGKVS